MRRHNSAVTGGGIIVYPGRQTHTPSLANDTTPHHPFPVPADFNLTRWLNEHHARASSPRSASPAPSIDGWDGGDGSGVDWSSWSPYNVTAPEGLHDLIIHSNNASQIGGGLFVSDTFLPLIYNSSIQGNAATFGGALFAESDSVLVGQGRSGRNRWLELCVVEGNVATYGGGSIALFTTDRPELQFQGFGLSTHFGDNPCDFESKGRMRMATSDISAEFDRGGRCEQNYYIGDPFSIALHLEDSFGTRVNRTILVDYDVRMSLVLAPRSECVWWDVTNGNVSSDPGERQLPPSGGAQWGDLALTAGDSSSTCRFVVRTRFSPPDFTVKDQTCVVQLKGCAPNFRMLESSSVLVCLPEDASSDGGLTLFDTILLIMLGAISALFLLVVLIFAGIYFFKFSKYNEYRHTEIPDFSAGDGATTLEELLNKKDINVIPWDDVTVLEKLGVGATGIVYRAKWKKSSGEVMEVAVKELHGIFDPTDSVVQEFVQEVALSAQLRHPNVVRFIGVARKGERELALITEVMSRGSLDELLNRKKHNLPWKLRLKLARDAAKGMAYLHRCNLIHRDLKPGNLLVDKRWVCKVGDFGISRAKPNNDMTMTAVGTPAYMAPEVMQGHFSEKADVYSFGIMLWELYKGRMPYIELNYPKIKLMEMVVEGLRPNTDGMPERLQQLIVDCWDTNPPLRPSFAELVLRLRRLENMDLPFEAYDSHPGTEGGEAEEDADGWTAESLAAVEESHGETMRDAFVFGASDRARELFVGGGSEDEEEVNDFANFEEDGVVVHEAPTSEQLGSFDGTSGAYPMHDLASSSASDAAPSSALSSLAGSPRDGAFRSSAMGGAGGSWSSRSSAGPST
eukprot:TRINITY_DN3532_c0_g1_i1.p1 TRINITY_DN3532_c0_g1~~TRINITY_DN3532_c0_g1_i1.p1  ORF type:complete len:853 (-),score=278.74 TRINITY_DN3532_c0_g1_i1:195-2753(-)